MVRLSLTSRAMHSDHCEAHSSHQLELTPWLMLLQYCLPTDSPDLARTMRPLALAMSHLVWARHKPDRFDSYSCGASGG